jgi:hypothetical protein
MCKKLKFLLILTSTLITFANPSFSDSCSVLALDKCDDQEICSKTILVTKGSNIFGSNQFDLEARKRKLECEALTASNGDVKYPDHMEAYAFECMRMREIANEFLLLFLNGSSADEATNFLLSNLDILDRANISVDEFVSYVQSENTYGSAEYRASEFGNFLAKECDSKHTGSSSGSDSTTSLQNKIPRYDVETFCENVKNVSGGSYQIFNTCIDAQQTAYDNLKRTYITVSSETTKYCEQIAEVSGGSYQILETCIQQENNAAGGKKKFKF